MSKHSDRVMPDPKKNLQKLDDVNDLQDKITELEKILSRSKKRAKKLHFDAGLERLSSKLVELKQADAAAKSERSKISKDLEKKAWEATVSEAKLQQLREGIMQVMILKQDTVISILEKSRAEDDDTIINRIICQDQKEEIDEYVALIDQFIRQMKNEIHRRK